MKYTYYGWAIALTALSACKTPLTISQVQPQKNAKITQDIPEKKEFINVITPYKKQMDDRMNSKISYTSVDLNKNGDNSTLGNLLADFTYEEANAWAKNNGLNKVDCAVINIGGIRSTIGVGDILLRHVFEVKPFENEIVIMKMKGKDMADLFDFYVKTQKNNPVSRLYIETEGGILKNALIQGKPLDSNRDYLVATSDFLALGGDDMKFFAKGEMIATGIKMRDSFIESFKKNPEIKSNKDIRLNFIGKKN